MRLALEAQLRSWRAALDSGAARRLEGLRIDPERRMAEGDPNQPWVTDSGGMILDCTTGAIGDPTQLASEVKAVSGVVEHGLFLGIARAALQVDTDGHVVRRERSGA